MEVRKTSAEQSGQMTEVLSVKDEVKKEQMTRGKAAKQSDLANNMQIEEELKSDSIGNKIEVEK